MEIPKIIHQIWYQGENKLPEKFHSRQKLWKDMHINWQYKLWDHKKMQDLIEKYPKYLKTYRNFKYMHQKIDFFKYLLLYDQGGAYVDMDTYSLKPLNGLIMEYPEAKLIISELPVNLFESYMIFGYDRAINNGTILSVPGNKFLLDLIDQINMDPNKFRSYSKYVTISRSTGPQKFTEVSLQHEKDPGFVILPAEILEPCYGNDTSCQPTSESYIFHDHSQTWLNPIILHAAKLYFFLRNNWIILVFIILVFITLT